MGDRAVGVRWSHPDPAALLRHALGHRHLPGAEVYDNASVVVGSAVGAATTKHVCHRANRRVFRSVSLRRVLDAVLLAVASHERSPTPTGYVDLAATPVLGPDGTVVLIDRDAVWLLDQAARRLGRAGHRIVDAPRVRLCVADRTVTLGCDRRWLDTWPDWREVDGDRVDGFVAAHPSEIDGAPVRRMLVDPFRVGLGVGGSLSPAVAGLSLLVAPAGSDDVTEFAELCRARTITLVGGRDELAAQFLS